MPSGVIAAGTLLSFENFSDLNGADRIGADGVAAASLLRPDHKAIATAPATKSETAHVQTCGQFIDAGSHAPAKARSQVNGHFFAKIEVTLHNK